MHSKSNDQESCIRMCGSPETASGKCYRKYHEFHLGHLHTGKVLPFNEEGGFITRYVSSITGPDNWHDSKGFVGNIQKFQTFLWDYQYGLENIRNHTIDFLMNKRK